MIGKGGGVKGERQGNGKCERIKIENGEIERRKIGKVGKEREGEIERTLTFLFRFRNTFACILWFHKEVHYLIEYFIFSSASFQPQNFTYFSQ